MTETWRPVVGDEDWYEVSDQGRVRSLRYFRGALRREPFVKLTTTRYDGYKQVSLHHRAVSVHRLVLEAFAGPAPAGYQCGHLNGRPADNRLENLRWVTPKENAHHKRLHGTMMAGDKHTSRTHPERIARGERVNTAKLTRDQVLQIRSLYAAGGVTCRELGERFRVSGETAWDVVRRRSWRHLDELHPTEDRIDRLFDWSH